MQYTETECGLACLAIIFSYYEHSVPLAILRDEAGISRDGTKASTLLTLAKQHEFHAEAYTLTLDDLAASQHPLILHWNFSHYVVFEGIRGKKVYINDPAVGRKVITLAMLDQSFTGVAVVLEPSLVSKKINRTIPQPSYLEQLTKKTRSLHYYSFFALFLMALLPLGLSGLNAVFINHILLAHYTSWLRTVIGLVVLFNALLFSVSALQQWTQHKASYALGLTEIAALLISMFQWPAKLYALRSKSECLSLLTQLDSVIMSFLMSTSRLVSGWIIGLLLGIGLGLINLPLALISGFMSLGFVAGIAIISHYKKTQDTLLANAEMQYYSASLSAFNQLETLALTGLQSWVYAQWLSHLYEKYQKQYLADHYQHYLSALTKSFQTMMPVIILLLGLHQLELGKTSLGGLLGFTGLFALFNRQMMMAADSFKLMNTVRSQLHRVEDVYSVPEDTRFSLPVLSWPEGGLRTLDIKNISFYYNKTSEPVLHAINVTIPAGKHIAFVGASGSGKSSLAKVLSGLYQPDEGDIQWGGVSLNQLTPECIAHIIAMVNQEAGLIQGSLLDNLTLWNKTIPLETVHRAIQLAELDDLVTKRGLQLELTFAHETISGGERQRIELARALIQNTPVLILDEATSALDIKTEQKIIDHLKSLNKTIIHIAHRLSTIRHCDTIYVLHQGRIIESGSHEILLAKRAYYWRLIQADHAEGEMSAVA